MRILTRLIMLAMTMGLLTGCQLVLEPPQETTMAEPVFTDDTATALDALITDGMAEIGIPGVSLAVVVDGEPVYLNGYGLTELGGDQPVTSRTGFHLASISKTLTSTAIMQLVETGKIDLDSPLTAYLPDFTMADPRYADMTIRQILSHTAGMPDSHDWVTEYTDLAREDEAALSDLASSFSTESLIFALGEDWDYSSLGYNILGHVVAEVSGQTYEEYIDEHIFSPLGMDQSTFHYKDVDPSLLASPHVLDEEEATTVQSFYPYSRVHSPSSTLNSNAEDMARYMAAHLNLGELDGTRILAPESYDDIHNIHGETWFGPPDDLLERHYGLGWTIGEQAGELIYGHAGLDPGFNSFIALVPDKSMAVFFAANRGNLDPFDPPAFMLRVPIIELLLEEQTAE